MHPVDRLFGLVKQHLELGQILVRPQGGLFLLTGLLLQLEPGLFQGFLGDLLFVLGPLFGLPGLVQFGLHPGHGLRPCLLNGLRVHHSLHGHLHRLLLQLCQLGLQPGHSLGGLLTVLLGSRQAGVE